MRGQPRRCGRRHGRSGSPRAPPPCGRMLVRRCRRSVTMDAVPTMDELLAEHGVTGSAVDHLHRLVADWQLLADLSFADLILFVPTQPGRFVAVAQMRPTTGPTAYQDDVVGHEATSGDRPQL